MDKLMKELRSSLLANKTVEIKDLHRWQLPVITYHVVFKRVKRSKMDILMKMMLLTFEQTDIRRAANFSELLLVEELFIEDLLQKMQRMGLVRLEREVYQLTSKGQNQLQTGIFIEEMEEESTAISYSPVHSEVWPVLTDSLPQTNEKLLNYRYANDGQVSEEQMLRFLNETENSVDEEGFQLEVAEVCSFGEQKIELVPCLEFQLYNKEQDTYYARVWNTWIGRWDDLLEKQIEEKERLQWREKWTVTSEESE
ncbi:hypothetical protein [Bacillus sp. AK128]